MSTLTLTVVAYQGRPADGSLHADFDETGGTIGRADTNQLVLPDPDRSISRVHAQIVYRHGRYALIDRGSSPVEVNGQAAKNDAEMVLSDGDRVAIGGYQLAVSLASAWARSQPQASGPGMSLAGMTASADDPFADLLGPLPSAAPQRTATAGPPDPLAELGLTAAATRSAPAAPREAVGAGAAAALAEDWNPFAPGASQARSAPHDAADALLGAGPLRSGGIGPTTGPAPVPPVLTDLVNASESESLDELFELHKGPSAGADPFAMSALAQPVAQPNMAAHADPVRSLDSAPVATSDTLHDTVSDLNLPFIAAPIAPPPVAAVPADPLAAPSAAPMLPEPLAKAPPAVASPRAWPTRAAPSHAETVLPTHPAEGRGPTADLSMSMSMSIPMSMSMAIPMPDPTTIGITPAAGSKLPDTPTATAPAAPAAPAFDMAALCQALCEGLDTTDLRIDALTPELMKLLGSLLRDATTGTIDLLFERTTAKRELKADAMIVRIRENNPLKFSPNADVALRHLLAPPARGVMGGEIAMRDAFIDLRAFQFGMLAGMRAAIDDTLDRFAPSALEARLPQRSGLHTLLPGSRKARLWETYAEQFNRIRDEATDDFQSVLGTAFLKAYDEHMARLDKDAS